MLTNRYDVGPDRLKGQKNIIEYLLEANKRVGDLETSLQAGNTSIEDGNLVIRNGDIIVSESDDTVVLRILHGALPDIRMFPLSENDTHRISWHSFDDPTASQSTVLSIETHPGGVLDGGKLLLTRDYVVLSYQPNGAEETNIFFNADITTPNIINFQCRWHNQNQTSSTQGLYMGQFTATSGFTTWTHTYFTPFATSVAPVFTVGVTGTTIQWGIENYSTSSFVIRFSTGTGNKLVTFWNFRN